MDPLKNITLYLPTLMFPNTPLGLQLSDVKRNFTETPKNVQKHSKFGTHIFERL